MLPGVTAFSVKVLGTFPRQAGRPKDTAGIRCREDGKRGTGGGVGREPGCKAAPRQDGGLGAVLHEALPQSLSP